MFDQERLLELTESYLKSLVAGNAAALSADFDAATPFGELGIDSFRVLKIIKSLEADFGTLPKTLLFENFNVEALARYFADKHRQTLAVKFSNDADSAPRAVPAPVTISEAPATTLVQQTSVRLLEADLPKHPELQACVEKLFAQYKSEGCVSRGTRNIAPNLFIGSERRGFFHYGRSKNIILVYAYTGPADYFPVIAQEMHQYCAERKFQLNIFADQRIASIGTTPFSATPFGVLQRMVNLRDFSLAGSAMRRLRYQVAKFEKAGACTTEEYQCGSNPDIDRNIASVIDQWCAGKPMVNPLIHIVREEILAGRLHPQHRLFLTRVDGMLHNVILISELCPSLDGYLMDLEFYTADMPLGGLEFAIIKIIETLVAEGRNLLSLGGTYGCRLTTSASADPAIDRILDDLHRQNIFNDEGNLQFKNKFRPENRTVYLCREAAAGDADNVIDIIMMIADPAKAQSSDEENHNAGAGNSSAVQLTAAPERAAVVTTATKVVIPGEPVVVCDAAHSRTDTHSARAIAEDDRARALGDCGFNPLNLTPEQVEIDLKTDSWAQLKSAAIDKQMTWLRSQLQQPVDVFDALKSIFPFNRFLLTDAGRTAEHLLCKAWPRKGVVPQNLLFPSGIYHQIDKGFTPREFPHPDVFRLDSNEPYKGNLSLDRLREQLAMNGAEIAFVCIEASDNASGGCPVSLQHLQEVKELLAGYSIPLVIDATRILENAQFIIDHESEHARKTIWAVAREMLACADVVVASLAKDFCVAKGGLIATNDEQLLCKLQELVEQEGGGLDVIDRKLIAHALQNRRKIETAITRRMQAVRSVWQALQAHGVPVSRPVGGHCVLIDVKQLPEFKGLAHPVASFLAWLYLKTGIRAGAHSVGMQKNTAINELVRLAIPVGCSPSQVTDIVQRLTSCFMSRTDIPELALDGAAAGALADVHARFRLINYHRRSATTDTAAVRSSSQSPQLSQAAPSLSASQSRRREIAIVGMAGRYPKARNLHEFWENLRQGRDCVDDMPPERLARRARHAFTRNYRGGFLEDVDRFDSLFFNISPREAEVLDPQERLFLEVAWEALEDAGYYPEILAPESTPRNIGVFVGAVWAMYQNIGVEQKLAGNNVNPNSFLWSVANRVSYWMNLTGPSMTVDTACSSSLTALYLACEAILKGDCEGAIVGGVNLDLHQNKFDINFAGGALSDDGVCRSFGAGANGYVAGEGVGALFIKPLDKALEDGDHIYGVIKSAVVNHGGRTSGYTVPNPKAHAGLIAAALEQAGIDARSIGYIEAHGTGTELGDPIEISGLTDAFDAYRVEHRSCAIGSVKTNIGHLEAAAGVVGVCKVLLQMKHRQLVPSLHSTHLNEHIDFARSPFYVPQQVGEWREREVDGVKLPLRAGISSFGAGGSNAHIILEQHEPAVGEHTPQTGGYLFPLSARNDEQLREMAQRLRTHLEQDSTAQLSDIAFTLQNGRKPFEHRLAIVAATRQELVARLGLFLEGKRDPDALSGHVKNAEGITKLLSRKEKEQLVSLLLQGRDVRKVAQLWIEGLLSDCRGVLQSAGRRVSLPTYPFADKRHWIGTSAAAPNGAPLPLPSGMHPLIDANESTFERQLFRKAFQDGEFFLRDHVVSQAPTLPGVAYLDLARKAGEIAAGRKVRRIRNVTWISPLTVTGSAPTQALIELVPNADAVLFEVFSEGEDGKKKLYAQGKLLYATEREAMAEPEYIDLQSIRARCSKVIAGKDAYPLFESLGLRYGPSFQVLQEVFSGGDEVLGRLMLPSVRNADFEEFVLHPSILDASMQAGVVAQLGASAGEMTVPYSIGEVELLQPLTRTCYSYVTRAKSDRNVGSRVSREHVTIVDEGGKVLARLRDCVGVPLVSVHEKSEASENEQFATLYYTHVWEEAPLEHAQGGNGSVLLFDIDERLRDACLARNTPTALVLPGEKFEDLGNRTYRINPRDRADYTRLFECLSGSGWTLQRICYAWPDCSEPRDEGALRNALEKGVYSFLFLCQALLEQKIASPVQLVYLYFNKEAAPQPHNEAINGFARALQLENPKVHCKVVEVRQTNIEDDAVRECVLAELRTDASIATTVRYDGHVRRARTLRKLDLAPLDDTASRYTALKHNGVYLITGGAGGLGLIFAEFLASQCQAKLVLTGRSTLSAGQAARLEALKSAGAEVLYIAADISSTEDVGRVIRESKDRFGRIDGIIHGAGVLRDSYLRKKTAEQMQAVFAPKIHGVFHLDEHTQDEDLDFFVMFSSLAGVGGNAGQADYAFANHYMDSFAAAREALRQRGQRSGKTLSLNWSLWADGGMKLDEQTELFFRKNLGIKPLRKEVGLEAFLRGLLSDRPQVAVLEGVQAKIEQAWGLGKKQAPPPATVTPERSIAADGEELQGLVIKELSRMVMDLLKLSAADLSLDSILTDLGFDSIGLATYANAINAKYRLDISPVLFFEYPSIRAIAGALCTEHASSVQSVHDSGKSAAASGTRATPAQPAMKSIEAEQARENVSARRFSIAKGRGASGSSFPGEISRENRFVNEPIAIVGIAGVMPQSETLEEFWDNLQHARNLVTEIPRDRWNWHDYDGNPLKEANKSNSRWGGFMKEIDKFDPLFFGITPREAEMMDPQQRIFIETVWRAVEDSGHKIADLSGTKTGVFVGVSAKDYIDVLTDNRASVDGYSASGNSHSILANRISFLLNLRGPSAPIDTACSSSLIALHRAVESIHSGSSDMAIVGGVQVMLTPVAHISLSSAGMLSVDGRCKTFDRDANGYVRGEGSGVIFIKPLSKALADGNPVYAVIRATAENHGGRVTNLTAPNPKAQTELLLEAYEKAQIDPATVGYIECHGTGTSLGDPIEIQALKKSFAELYRKHDKAPPKTAHCGLSSVKTNIGHLEPAAGIASLLKVLLAMKHRKIPALLHFENLNPYIDLSGSPFYIVDETVPWEAATGVDGSPLPRRAGVSSFGWGGANAHVVLEEYIPRERQLAARSKRPLPIVLSARTAERLKVYAQAVLAHLRKHDVDLTDLAYTLQIGRDVMSERLGILASSVEQLREKLQAYIEGDKAADGIYQGNAKRNKEGISIISDDDEIRESVLQKFIAGGKWSKLLDLWVNGLDVEWSRLWQDDQRGAVQPRRISLPTYPFARERYWVDTALKQGMTRPAESTKTNVVEEASRTLLFQEYWQRQPVHAVESPPRGRQTLVFADQAFNEQIAAGAGPAALADAVFVYQGESYRQVSERIYHCRYNDLADIQNVLAHAAAASGRPLDIIYTWSRNQQESGIHALFKLFTAIKECARPVAHVTLVGAYDPARVETCWDYSWIGFERSLKLYLAKTPISLLYSNSSAVTAQQLLDATGRSGVVWYRNDQRLVLAYQPFEPDQAARRSVLKQNSGYVITGGSGALGLKVAHYLARRYRSKLLLLGRKPLSPEIQQKLDELRQSGAVEAHYRSVDLGDRESVRALARDLPFDIGGIIHAAGVESTHAFFEKTAAGIDEVLRPKTVGTLLLDEELAQQPLDFVCYFSSSSALLGDFGSCDYAIANRFQMAYGQHRAQRAPESGKTIVINWPLWDEGGMGMGDPKQTALYLKRTGQAALGTTAGLDLWHELMQLDQPQTLVMVGKPSRVSQLLERLYKGPAPDRAPGASRPRAATSLSSRQIEKLKDLIKADLLIAQDSRS